VKLTVERIKTFNERNPTLEILNDQSKALINQI